MGKIVVATDGASYEQLIDERVSGYLCERDNPESFLQGIREALSLNEDEKEKMIKAAQKSVERLEPDKLYRKYLKYYESVIEAWGKRK